MSASTLAKELDGEELRPAVDTSAPATGLRRDTLASGMALMLALTIAQRMVGVVRNLLFCRWLSPEELGVWELSFSFIMMAAPLVVLGVPCSLARYVEYFSHRGQLRSYARRIVFWAVACCALALATMWTIRGAVATLLYDRPGLAPLVWPAGLALAGMIGLNLLTEFLGALRLNRAANSVRFAHAISFSMLSLTGLAWLAGGQAETILWSFTAATWLAAVCGVAFALSAWRELPADRQPLSHGEFWGKLAPIVAALWVGNLLGNSFELCDRWMIVHFSGLSPIEAAGMVGQYYSCRMIPILIMGVVASVESLLLPYLSCDWETNRRGQVSERLNLAVKIGGLAAFLGGVALLVARPLVFDVLLQGRYQLASHALPPIMAYTVWAAMLQLSRLYLNCAERPGRANMAMLVGIAVNVTLNYLWLPRYGLDGAAWATAIACLTSLCLVIYLGRDLGYRWDPSLRAILALPVFLTLGPLPLLASIAAVVWAVTCCRWFFPPHERRLFQETWQAARGAIARRWNGRFNLRGEIEN